MPENTRLAFVKALDLGADALEFDVQLTRDEVPVVIHDETLDRTTSGTGAVADHDLADIVGLDAGSWFTASYSNVTVPTLEEVLSTFAPKITCNIELKPDKRVSQLVRHALTVVARLDAFANVIFSSFSADAMREIHKHSPDARIGILTERGGLARSFKLAAETGAETLNPPVGMVDRPLVTECHERGLGVLAWTANEQGEIALLSALGVDGIFSDHPDRVRKQGTAV